MEIAVGLSTHGEKSAREVAGSTRIRYTTVWVDLRRAFQCYPYKIQRRHNMLPGDFVNQWAFTIWLFLKMAEGGNRLSKVICKDEAHFTLRESVHTHNNRIWVTKSPIIFVQTPLDDENVMVWCEFTTYTVIRPFFSQEMRNYCFVTVRVAGERKAAGGF